MSSLLVIGALALAAQAEPAPQVEEPGLPQWAVRLGLRVERANQAFPIVDRVVLVPDTATYVDELSRWTPQGRWPVLFEDDHLAPMFIRRFRPAQVIRREPATPLPKDSRRRQARLEAIVVRAWGGDPGEMSLRETFNAQDHQPPGIVIADPDDPAWTAAIALAAGRGQPLAWLTGAYGRPNSTLNSKLTDRLLNRVLVLAARSGYPYAELGDAIDTITLCRAVAGKADVGRDQAGKREPLAISDLLGRRGDGSRYAFAGWIFGDEVRCAYVAMCSLFLPRERVWLYNTYSGAGEWGAYGMSGTAVALSEMGYQVRPFSGDRATLGAWGRMLGGGISTDVLIMNTKGNTGFFDLSAGRAYAVDVPVLNEPLALHLIHSWSMAAPDATATVGGQWLARGVYACVGAVHEPLLEAFVPPAALAKRFSSGVPFLVAARRWEGPLSRPWKVNTFGDPLMLCGAPGAPRQRVQWQDANGLDLTEHIAALMRKSEVDESGEAIAEAMHVLVLLGRDDIAVQMWRLAEQRGTTLKASQAAVGALFRRRDIDGFLRAWEELPSRDETVEDMLWHLLLPQLATVDKDVLLQLQASVRRRQPYVDLERLAPHLTRAFGPQHTREVIERSINRAARRQTREALKKLLRKK